jgi:hypothetical protein
VKLEIVRTEGQLYVTVGQRMIESRVVEERLQGG